MIKKTASLVYGGGAYLLFLGAFLYLAAFETNITPHSISRPASMPPALATLVDVALVAGFGLQHSIMARPGFKSWWTRIVPPHLERSTFVWISSALVIALVQLWQPVEGDIWNLTGVPRIAMYTISALGWLMIPVVSHLTDHYELFGLRQVWDYALGRPTSKSAFRERSLYKKVRHPMMLAFLVAFWAAPHMTVGHLLFAGLMTGYILVGIHFEERGLVRTHGPVYRDYQARVPRLLPIGTRDIAQPAPLKARTAQNNS